KKAQEKAKQDAEALERAQRGEMPPIVPVDPLDAIIQENRAKAARRGMQRSRGINPDFQEELNDLRDRNATNRANIEAAERDAFRNRYRDSEDLMNKRHGLNGPLNIEYGNQFFEGD